MKSFFEINKLWQDIVKQLEESEGELTDELTELMAINQSDLAEKVEEHITLVNFIGYDNVNLDAEIQRLQCIRNRNSNFQERIKLGLIKAVKLHGKEGKLKAGLHNLSIRKGNSLEVIDATKIPDQFVTYDFTMKINAKEEIEELQSLYPENAVIAKIDKKALKKAITDGLETDSCKIVESENLQIK